MRVIVHWDGLLVKVTCLRRNEHSALFLLGPLSEDARVAAQLISVGYILQLREKQLKYIL